MHASLGHQAADGYAPVTEHNDKEPQTFEEKDFTNAHKCVCTQRSENEEKKRKKGDRHNIYI